MIADMGHRCTIAEFEAFITRSENQERRFELIDGQIVEKMRTEESGVFIARFAMWVGQFVHEQKLGRVVLPAYHHAAKDDFNDFLPDVSFTRKERLLPLTTKGAVPQIPDLVVEVPSRDDKDRDLSANTRYYLAHGARLVWIVDLKGRVVHVYSQNAPMVFKDRDSLSGGAVLPGFTLAVRDIFDVE